MRNFDIDNFIQEVMDEIHVKCEELTNLNVMVLGKTGVGKSTIVNSLFQREKAKTGISKPITQEITKISIPNFPLTIYDTPGLELKGENNKEKLLEKVKEKISECYKTTDINQVIHCIWYCISTTSHRVEDQEFDFIKMVSEENKNFNIPVFVVLTQSYKQKDEKELETIIKNEINKNQLSIVDVVPVVFKDFVIDDECKINAKGLDGLTESMKRVMPDAIMIESKFNTLDSKIKRAHNVIAVAATAAGVTGATPIPFSDAAILVPTQIGMIAKITSIFQLPIEKSTMSAIVTATLGTAAASIIGKTVVSGIFKLIPGVGSFIGGAISAGTAAAITVSLGNAYISIMTKIAKGELDLSDLDSDVGKKILANEFSQELKVKRNAQGEAV